jgi:ketosteroid isomerase-like protein
MALGLARYSTIAGAYLTFSRLMRNGRYWATLPYRRPTIAGEFLDAVIDPFNALLSRRLIPTVRGLYADGDMVIALFDGEGSALDGKPYRNTYTWYRRMRDGRILEVVGLFDTIEYADFWTRITRAPAPSYHL